MRNRIMAVIVACLFLIHPYAFSAEPASFQPSDIASLSPETQEVLLKGPTLVQGAPGTAEGLTVQTQVFESIDPKDVARLVEMYSAQSGQDVLVSTDSEEVVKSVANNFDDALQKNKNLKKPSFLMFGQKAKNRWNGLKEYVRNSYAKTKELARENKVGLYITVAMTTYDSMVWFHTETLKDGTSVTDGMKASIILFNWIVNLRFGVNPDAWSNMAEKIDHKFMSLLQNAGLVKSVGSLENKSAFLRRYFANFGMYFALQSTRYSILNFDHLLTSMQSAGFWVPIATIAAAGTFTSFGWGEFSARISESQHPVAKKTVKIFSYIRQVFMGYFAPSSSLINGTSLSPWAIVVGHGVAGLAAFYKRNKIVNWLEGKPAARAARTTKKWANSYLPDGLQIPIKNRCVPVFAD